MHVHLVDGTYELFRHYYGSKAAQGRETESADSTSAARGVVATVLGMLESGATHLGVATDHVIESFRNDLWPTYKTSAGVPADLLTQFVPLEEALEALGVSVWPMVDLEADDALASAAAVAAADDRVDNVVIWTVDKDLGQCVGGKVVQFDRKSERFLDVDAIRDKFGVPPESIPDYLALVGDSADGFPGLPGWGAKSASVLLSRYGTVEAIPDDPAAWDGIEVRGAAKLGAALAAGREVVTLFKDLATLRINAAVGVVDDWEWRGPRSDFADWCDTFASPRMLERAHRLADERSTH